MNIRILLILLVVSVLLAFARRWRTVGMTLSALLAVLLVWFIANQPITKQDSGVSQVVSSSSEATPAIPLIPIATLQLDGNGAPWRLTGTIVNSGDIPIRTTTLSVQRLDCPSSDSADVDCDLVWRGQHTLRMSIAAAKTARVDDSFYSHETVPRLKGVARDRIAVISVQ